MFSTVPVVLVQKRSLPRRLRLLRLVVVVVLARKKASAPLARGSRRSWSTTMARYPKRHRHLCFSVSATIRAREYRPGTRSGGTEEQEEQQEEEEQQQEQQKEEGGRGRGRCCPWRTGAEVAAAATELPSAGGAEAPRGCCSSRKSSSVLCTITRNLPGTTADVHMIYI